MLRRLGVVLGIAVSLAFFTTAAGQQEKAKQKGDRKGGQQKAEAAPPEKTGVAIGEKAPPFTLKDQSGKERRLDEWLKDGKVAIVFHRSASW